MRCLPLRHRRVPPCAAKTCAVHPVFARVVGEPRGADPSNVHGPVKQNASPEAQSEAPRRGWKPGPGQNPGPENQDSQHMLEQPRGSFPEDKGSKCRPSWTSATYFSPLTLSFGGECGLPNARRCSENGSMVGGVAFSQEGVFLPSASSNIRETLMSTTCEQRHFHANKTKSLGDKRAVS